MIDIVVGRAVPHKVLVVAEHWDVLFVTVVSNCICFVYHLHYSQMCAEKDRAWTVKL